MFASFRIHHLLVRKKTGGGTTERDVLAHSGRYRDYVVQGDDDPGHIPTEIDRQVDRPCPQVRAVVRTCSARWT